VDRQTFDRLMIEHLPQGHRFAIRLVRDPADAEDLVHDALVRAAGAWRGFREDSSFRTWFFQIIVNVFRDRLRRRIGAASLDGDELEARAANPVDRVVADELGEQIAACVSALPPRQREVLVLVAFEQMSPSQAAEVLEISEESARASLHYARQRLKQQLAVYLSDAKRER
jgi:RNA polymerase sigma-70 factor (ECF subfamily)